MAPATRALPLACLMLLLLRRAPGAGAQASRGFELHQPQDKVSVTAGETLNLTCTVSGEGPAGAVKWLKGWGSGNETIYEQKGFFPRVTRVANGSDMDFNIRISDVRPEDAGTYYCVKFRISGISDEAVFQRGKGTVVSVHAKPSAPVVSGPDGRAGPGQSVSFTCTAGGFSPEDIAVQWLKDGIPIRAQQPQITSGQTKFSYDMSSTVTVRLQEDDIRSQLACEVRHLTLPAPLRGTYELGKALRVAPKVRVVAAPPNPVEVNKTVTFTCRVEGFYPGDVAVAWLENGTEMKVVNTSRLENTSRGLFRVRSLVEVRATEEKNGSVFTCQMMHDAQGPVVEKAVLQIAAPAREGLSDRSQPGPHLLSSPILWLGILMEKGLLGGLLIFLFKRGKA
ncbi:signal-regulatory protein beta-1-like [Pelecanus crispus]|uniref:signal-regulatory protein beta-1-like n=1 Tax=Pelecanus crispus TaxID=36300 RepID=UPI003F5D2D32